MIKKGFWFFTLLSVLCPGFSESHGNNNTLVGVAVLFRHGDRAPLYSYPNDPYVDEKYWPEGLGELLKSGWLRQYDLGLYLRKRYQNFLSADYSPREIYVLSSDTGRSIMSANANLAGLYDRRIYCQGSDHAQIMIPPVHTVPIKEDGFIGMVFKECPAYYKLYMDSLTSLNHIRKLKYPDIYELISENTGWSYDKISFFRLYDIFNIYSMRNLSYIPPWYQILDKEIVEDFAQSELAQMMATMKMKRTRAGPFFNYLLNRFDSMFNKSEPKFLMLSGHDITVNAALSAMGDSESHPPDYTATVIWELHEHLDGKKSIRVFYKKNATGALRKISVHGCNFICSYRNFKTKMEPILMDDTTRREECGLGSNQQNTNSLKSWSIFVVLFLKYLL